MEGLDFLDPVKGSVLETELLELRYLGLPLVPSQDAVDVPCPATHSH